YQKVITLPSGETRTVLLAIQPVQIRHQECLLTISTDITQQKQVELALRSSEESLRVTVQSLRAAQQRQLHAREEFTRQLLNAEERERQYLAAELHDGLGQSLSIIKNQACFALAQPEVPAVVAEHLKTISQSASEAIAEVRQLVRNLRPFQIQQLGLTDSIR